MMMMMMKTDNYFQSTNFAVNFFSFISNHHHINNMTEQKIKKNENSSS